MVFTSHFWLCTATEPMETDVPAPHNCSEESGALQTRSYYFRLQKTTSIDGFQKPLLALHSHWAQGKTDELALHIPYTIVL